MSHFTSHLTSHLTLQEVIDRVGNNLPSRKEQRAVRAQSHHPEFYIPRITRVIAGLLFGAFPSAGRMVTAPQANQPRPVPW